MATAKRIVDPDADSKADWTESPAGSAFDRLNDGTRYPTAPNVASDFITSSTTDQICRVTFGNYTLVGSEVTVGAKLYVYIDTPGRACRVQFQHTSGGTVSVLDEDIPAGTNGWQVFSVVAPFTQAMMDGLQVNFSPRAGSGATTIYAAYAEFHTSTDFWSAAMDKIWANRVKATGLSAAAGFLGGDAFSPVDLNGTVIAFAMRDCHMATAAGQQQALGVHPTTPGAGRATFVRSAIGIASNKALESGTFTVTAGAGTTNYFPNTADGRIRWPQAMFIRNGRLFCVGMLETSNIRPTGRWVSYCDDFAANPTNPALWTWTHAATYPGGLTKVAVGAQGIYDNSATDGFVYLFDDGTLFTTRKPTSIYRLPVAQFDDATDWTGGEWWTGSGWSKDKPGTPVSLPPMLIGRKKPRGGTYDFELAADQGVNEGTVHHTAANKFQLTGVFDAPWTWDPIVQLGTVPYHMGYSLTANDTPGSKFAAPTVEKVALTEVEDWAYFGVRTPLTWAGMGADDQAWGYNGNADRTNNFEAAYFPKLLKVTNVT